MGEQLLVLEFSGWAAKLSENSHDTMQGIPARDLFSIFTTTILLNVHFVKDYNAIVS